MKGHEQSEKCGKEKGNTCCYLPRVKVWQRKEGSGIEHRKMRGGGGGLGRMHRIPS